MNMKKLRKGVYLLPADYEEKKLPKRIRKIVEDFRHEVQISVNYTLEKIKGVYQPFEYKTSGKALVPQHLEKIKKIGEEDVSDLISEGLLEKSKISNNLSRKKEKIPVIQPTDKLADLIEKSLV